MVLKSAEQPWAGDDQDWWDWYVTLAANPVLPAELDRGPSFPDVPAARDDEIAAALREPYPLTESQREQFRAEAFVKLPAMLSPGVIRRLAERIDALLRPQNGQDHSRRFIALEQMWLHDDLMRAVALSPRLGNVAAALAGVDVRIYHDNVLSKEPGCGRTPWHHDAEHFPLDTPASLTVWMPLSDIPRSMGPLSFARHPDLREIMGDIEPERVDTSYDVTVSERIGALGVAVEDGPFAAGDVSFHGARCFHTAGSNLTSQPRRALATTYYPDGARVIDNPTLFSGAWQDFLPGVSPGGLAATSVNPVVGRVLRGTS